MIAWFTLLAFKKKKKDAIWRMLMEAIHSYAIQTSKMNRMNWWFISKKRNEIILVSLYSCNINIKFDSNCFCINFVLFFVCVFFYLCTSLQIISRIENLTIAVKSFSGKNINFGLRTVTNIATTDFEIRKKPGKDAEASVFVMKTFLFNRVSNIFKLIISASDSTLFPSSVPVSNLIANLYLLFFIFQHCLLL